MRNGTPQGFKEYASARRQKKRWLTSVMCLACVVVFCTVYALVLPAIALEANQALDCTYVVHEHTEDCYDSDNNLICGLADYVVHTHDNTCYDSNGKLICKLDEVEVHKHDSSCYTSERGELICTEEDHEHTNECYEMKAVLNCTKPEVILHTHTDECYENVTNDEGEVTGQKLICELLQVEEHQHSAECLVQAESANGLTDEEQAQVDAVIAKIEELLALDEASAEQASEVYAAYAALSDAQKAAVTNADELMNMVEALSSNDGVNAVDNSEDNPEIPAAVLAELVEKYGIYPGTMSAVDGKQVWTAYNGEEADAAVKAVVTLPAGVQPSKTITVGGEEYKAYSYLYIREVKSDGTYYPTNDTLKAAIGDSGLYDDVQCYAIHWVTFYQKDGEWMYELQTESVLEGDDSYAEVEILYLGGNKLTGAPATHALQVFNSRDIKGTVLESTASTLTGIMPTDDGTGYSEFKFQTNRGGPYVFVTKQLEYLAYVSSVTASIDYDGTSPFDTESETITDKRTDGYDTSANNGIVRTFDEVKYKVKSSIANVSDNEVSNKGTLGFMFSVEKSLTQAAFDTNAMSWILDSGAAYQIQYLDKDNTVILYLDKDGNLHKTEDANLDENGFYTDGTATSVNALATGSTKETGAECYQYSKVVSQRVIGTYHFEGTSTSTATLELTCGIKVLNDINNATLKPSFKVWMVGNELNYGYKQVGDGGHTSEVKEIVTANELDEAPEVTISAGTFYNTEIKKNGYLSYLSWFDFTNGVEVTSDSTTQYTVGDKTVTGADLYKLLEALGQLTENYEKSDPAEYTNDNNKLDSSLLNGATLADYAEIFSNIRYGRMHGYGIDIQLASTVQDAEKGLKGISFPYGDVSLAIDTTIQADSQDEEVKLTQYSAVLWDYKANVNSYNSKTYTYEDGSSMTYNNAYKGNLGRNLFWGSIKSTTYAVGLVPYNYRRTNSDLASNAYNGGYWELDGNGALPEVKSTSSAGKSSNSAVYNFTVSGYDFDLNNYIFPTCASNTSEISPRYAYEFPFSAGFIQVLNVTPRTSSGTVNQKLEVTVGNLTATSISEQKLEHNATDGEVVYDHETNTAGQDNSINTSLTLYTPGNFVKYNGFNKFELPSEGSITIGANSLASGYWSGKAYDASAFVGEKLRISGAAYLSSASDYQIGALNLLQLFDSKVLKIEGAPSFYIYGYTAGEDGKEYELENGAIKINTKCDITYLYAADPKHQEGYDTNNPEVLKYMNTVREENLIYFENLEDLEKAGYTCVGVLAEVRDCKIYNVMSSMLSIPVQVKDVEGIAGKTVATVNAVRAWQVGADAETMKDISWKNGIWNDTENQNTLDGYVSINQSSSNMSGNGWQLNNGDGTKGYTKVEYENGKLTSDANSGGSIYGNSLMILSYKAGINIAEEKASYQLSGTVDATFTLQDIHTDTNDDYESDREATTDLNIQVDLTAAHTSGGSYADPDIALASGTYKVLVPLYERDENGNVKINTVTGQAIVQTDESGKQAMVEIEISSTSTEPTSVTFYDEATGQDYTYTIYSVSKGDKSVEFVLQDVPVGATLPNITFQVTLGTKLSDDDTVTATASISGSGDQREYSKVNGNQASASVHVYTIGGTALTKDVNNKLIELDGTLSYSITYSNSSSTNTIDTAYFYDILPNNNDGRGSRYDGANKLSNLNFKIVDSDKKETIINSDATVTIYYSTLEVDTLVKLLSGFSGTMEEDAGASSERVENMLTGTVDINGAQVEVFKELGTMKNGTFNKTADDLENKAINAIFVRVQNMGPGSDIVMDVEIQTKDNEAADLYVNTAWAWIVDDTSSSGSAQTEPLRSERPESRVVSRSISGVVWFDKNLNGVKDSGEDTLSGVTATLFKWDETQNKYVECKENVTGAGIYAVTTGENGAYSFNKLAAGQYVVAFSGAALDKYTGATTYQVNKVNDASSNDGVALSGADGISFAGIDSNTYKYAIAYSLTENQPAAMSLGTLKQYEDDLSLLDNYKQDIDHQNLGVVIAGYELPETGGTGTTLLTIGGLLIMAGAIGYGYRLKRRRGRSETD